MKKRKILLTGASGQLGSAVQEISKDYPEFEIFCYSKADLDIINAEELSHVFDSGRFEYCINAAAYTQVDLAEIQAEKCFQVNVKGPENLAVNCLENNCTLIHISSDYVYHPAHEHVLNEMDPTNPVGIYAQSKLAGEQKIQNILNNHIIIRTSWVFGKSGKNFVKTMLELGEKNTDLQIVSDQVGSPTYAKDLAVCCMDIIRLATQSSSFQQFGIYNFSNTGFTTWADFARKIFKLAGLKVKVRSITTSEFPKPVSRPLNSRLNKNKITKLLNRKPRSWESALKEFIEDIS